MERILQHLAADYARSRNEYRIENVTLLLVPAMLAVVGFAVAVQS